MYTNVRGYTRRYSERACAKSRLSQSAAGSGFRLCLFSSLQCWILVRHNSLDYRILIICFHPVCGIGKSIVAARLYQILMIMFSHYSESVCSTVIPPLIKGTNVPIRFNTTFLELKKLDVCSARSLYLALTQFCTGTRLPRICLWICRRHSCRSLPMLPPSQIQDKR